MLSLTLFYRKGLPFLNEHGLFVISIYTNYFTLSINYLKTNYFFYKCLTSLHLHCIIFKYLYFCTKLLWFRIYDTFLSVYYLSLSIYLIFYFLHFLDKNTFRYLHKFLTKFIIISQTLL